MQFNFFKKDIFKIPIIVLLVLFLSWGITKATQDELASATTKFNVIGTVSDITPETLSLVDARGTDNNAEELYNLNISYLDKVETSTYDPLVPSDIKMGDTIIAQGVTNGKTFFIQRIILFPSTPLPFIQEDIIATSTDAIATSTEDIASSTQEGTAPVDTSDITPSESITDIATSSDEQATSTEDVSSSTTDQIIIEESTSTTASTTETIIDTISEVVEEVIETTTEIIDTIVDTVTGTEEIEQETVPNLEPIESESSEESTPIETQPE